MYSYYPERWIIIKDFRARVLTKYTYQIPNTFESLQAETEIKHAIGSIKSSYISVLFSTLEIENIRWAQNLENIMDAKSIHYSTLKILPWGHVSMQACIFLMEEDFSSVEFTSFSFVE